MAFALDAAACDAAEQQFNEADVVLSQQIINEGGSAPAANFEHDGVTNTNTAKFTIT